jgi:predicted transcriptional regulator
MPEISELQQIVLEIVKAKAIKNGLFGNLECSITNQEIFDTIKPTSKKPSEYGYITTVLKRLAAKGKISIKTSSIVGLRGPKRIITIL